MAFDKDKAKIANLAGIDVADSVSALADRVDILIIAVKPQDFDEVLQQIKVYIKGKLVISIAAGITCLGVKGLHGCDEGVSIERLVTDNELIDYLNFVFSRSISIDESTLEYEKIKSKARGKWFLEDLNDDRKMKEMYWNSDIFYAGNYEDWHENIGRENIRKKVDKILKENFPPSLMLPIEKVETIEGIMRAHVKDKGFVDRLKNDLKRILKK